jgi:hypothetical protein
MSREGSSAKVVRLPPGNIPRAIAAKTILLMAGKEYYGAGGSSQSELAVGYEWYGTDGHLMPIPLLLAKHF